MACVLVYTYALIFPLGVELPQSAGEGDVLWRAPVWPVFWLILLFWSFHQMWNRHNQLVREMYFGEPLYGLCFG